MTEGTYAPGQGKRITPTVVVTENRFIGFDSEQITVAGNPVMGGAMVAIVAGAHGNCFISGSVLIEAGAAVPLIGGFAWVMSDAVGRVVPYVAGQTVAGFVTAAASAITHKIEVNLLPLGAPIV